MLNPFLVSASIPVGHYWWKVGILIGHSSNYSPEFSAVSYSCFLTWILENEAEFKAHYITSTGVGAAAISKPSNRRGADINQAADGLLCVS